VTAVTGRADSWIRRTTIGCVGMLAVIAGTVLTCTCTCWSLVELHGQPGWVAALTPSPGTVAEACDASRGEAGRNHREDHVSVSMPSAPASETAAASRGTAAIGA
jgi:hypothetical protein